MTKLEKVIKALETCTKDDEPCDRCPYWRDNYDECDMHIMLRDARDVLKGVREEKGDE